MAAATALPREPCRRPATQANAPAISDKALNRFMDLPPEERLSGSAGHCASLRCLKRSVSVTMLLFAVKAMTSRGRDASRRQPSQCGCRRAVANGHGEKYAERFHLFIPVTGLLRALARKRVLRLAQ
jgi:hypothetical protein